MLSGSHVAIVTPFSRDGAVDLDVLADLVEWHLEQGTAGIVACGTTGEAATLRPEEREAVCRRAVEAARGRCPVLAGAGTNATWSAVALAEEAGRWGVDGLLVVTPYYNKPAQEGLYRHFEAVAAASRVPIVLYDVPSRTGVRLAEETIHRLARLPRVVALKDAAGDVARAGRLAAETPLAILSGDDALTLDLMEAGAKGVISVAANVAPAAMAELCATRDRAIHERLAPLFRALFVESNPIPVKFALSVLGRCANVLRLPLTPLSREHEEAVRAALREAVA